MIRVLLVDDQALVRGGFRSILDGQEDIEVVGEAGTGAEAVDSALTLLPDVILMDIRMPRVDGIESTRWIADPGQHGKIQRLANNTLTIGLPLLVRRNLFLRIHELPDAFVVRCADLKERDVLLKAEPGNFLITAHYDGYPAVLVRLS